MGSPVKAREWEKTLTVKCRLCGGSKCKRCSESAALAKTGSPVLGLHADWVTDRVLGMMRPSSRLMKDYQIAQQFAKLRISAVFNLTLPGEHPYCGDGLVASGFPYDPETDLMQHNIRFYNFGWEDMTTPTLPFMMDIVKVMASVLQDGHQKVAVHCHAGYGRTGLAIACALIFMHNIPPAHAVAIVRRDRPGSVQTAAQAKFVHSFHAYINAAKVVFALPGIHDRFTLAEMVEHQNRTAHGERRLALPKVLDFLCAALERAAEAQPAHVAAAFVAYVPLRALDADASGDVLAAQEAHVRGVYEVDTGSSAGRGSSFSSRALASPPPPSSLAPSIGPEDLFPIKVALNVGETSWADAAARCTSPAFFPVLVLDWLEHLAEPLLDSTVLDAVATHDGDTPALKSKALNTLPPPVVKSLERVLHCVRSLEKRLRAAETTTTGGGGSDGSSSVALVDAVSTRAAMALFHINRSASPELARHATFVAMLVREWQAPKRLELNLESLQKLGKSPSVRRLSHSDPKHLELSPTAPRVAHRAAAANAELAACAGASDHAHASSKPRESCQDLASPPRPAAPDDLLSHLPKPRELSHERLSPSASTASSPAKIEPLHHLRPRTPSGSPQKLEVPALVPAIAPQVSSPRALAPPSSPLKSPSLREKESEAMSSGGAGTATSGGGGLSTSSSACSLPRVRGGDRYMNKLS